jgi:hypothetical protein
MKTHEKRPKEAPGPIDKRDSLRKGDGEPKSPAAAEDHHSPAVSEDATARISFSVDFYLVEGQMEGEIVHRLTGKPMKFIGLDQAAIIQFMHKYLSRLEKGIIRPPQEELPQAFPLEAEQAPEEITAAPLPLEMRTRSFDVFPAGATYPTEIVRQGQPFQINWCFDPPPNLAEQGEILKYRVSICRKQFGTNGREMIGEAKGETECDKVLTACIRSEPLPSGTYRLEANASFSLKSERPEWHSTCQNTYLLQVV